MLHIYHPNKSIKGFACSFWISNRDNSLFATLIKQSGWDNENQNGLFKGSMNDPSKKVNIKLSSIEACAILDCIDKNIPFTTFHSNDESPKSISFTPWMTSKTNEENETQTQRGYSFSITVGRKEDPSKNSFYIGLSFAEARLIREFIVFSLHQSFNRSVAKSTSETPID